MYVYVCTCVCVCNVRTYACMMRLVMYAYNTYYNSACCCHRNKRFRGRSQQDSHELFRTLLDGIRTEEAEVSIYSMFVCDGCCEIWIYYTIRYYKLCMYMQVGGY